VTFSGFWVGSGILSWLKVSDNFEKAGVVGGGLLVRRRRFVLDARRLYAFEKSMLGTLKQ
jgi:hypothetical protein